MRALSTVLLLCTVLFAAGCERITDPRLPAGDGPLLVVSAPLASQPWIGRSVARGAQLAVDQHNAGGAKPKLRLEILDNGGSPTVAVTNARTALRQHAAALITDGTGASAVSRVTDPASLPVFVVFQGGADFTDARSHPSIFRLAPANKFLSRRLADYLAGKSTSSVGLLSDDSSYGREGAAQLATDLAHDGIDTVFSGVLPVAAADVSAQVLAARRAGARALVIWAGAPDIAQTVRAARVIGWQVPVFTSPTGEDPLVRQQLADRPAWLDGLTFVSVRITSEQGPAPYNQFRAAYEHRYGTDRLGVSAAGRPVIEPPDWSMFSYDAVRLTSAALAITAGSSGPPLLAAVEGVSVPGANGDQRGFGTDNREGVSSSDMYFARFADLRFAAVTDDPLSTRLPDVAQ